MDDFPPPVGCCCGRCLKARYLDSNWIFCHEQNAKLPIRWRQKCFEEPVGPPEAPLLDPPKREPSLDELKLRQAKNDARSMAAMTMDSQERKETQVTQYHDDEERRARFGVLVLALCVLAVGLISVLIVGWTTIDVPAGQTAYVYSRPLVFSGGGFVKALPGPARMNFCWRKYSVAIITTQCTIDEAFAILAKDDLQISFNAHVILSVKSGEDDIRTVVERYTGTDRDWYKAFFQERFRSFVYDSVRAYDSRSAKEQRGEIATEVKLKAQALCEGTPFVIHDVVMGNIAYPKIVQDAVEQKLAAQQQLEQMDMTVQIAKKQAEAEVERSRGLAKAQEIINGTLTTQYLRHEYVQALMEAGKHPSSTIVYVPLGPDGLPLVLDTATPKAAPAPAQ